MGFSSMSEEIKIKIKLLGWLMSEERKIKKGKLSSSACTEDEVEAEEPVQSIKAPNTGGA